LIFLSNVYILAIPLRGGAVDISPNAKWKQNGTTVAGGNELGNEMNQLSFPYGLYVDDDQTLYIADCGNNRIMEWKYGATSGKVVAGGNRQGNGLGNGTHQLNYPWDVIVNKERDSLIISDSGNKRVVRWPHRNDGDISGETIIPDVDCHGLTVDENGFLYVVDKGYNEVIRYRMNGTDGRVVAGGNGLHQTLLSLVRIC
jgi:sugar lactone lactonase YvrE